VPQHHDVGAPRRRVFRGREEAPQRGPRGEEVPERGADDADAALARGLTESDRGTRAHERRMMRERRRAVPDVREARVLDSTGLRPRRAAHGEPQIDAMDRGRVLEVRIRSEHQPVHDAEHRGVGPDPERQRDDHRRREPGRLPHPPQRVPEILPEIVEELRE
jgi:hypothetical protein